ncbi:MAG: glycosyltransferase family 39 protein [Tannerellaceae bacterium]|jgi:uncharacterized membrane protein|nr:glycosyltransferase family 39 protein [Tannerellaceae bacterium]
MKTNHLSTDSIRRALFPLSILCFLLSVAMLVPEVRAFFILFVEALRHQTLPPLYWEKLHIQLFFAAFGGITFSIILLIVHANRFPLLYDFVKKRTNSLAWTLMTVFSLSALLLAVSNQAIWLDEAFSLAFIQRSWGELFACMKLDVLPPLYFLMEKCWASLWGDGIFAMKCLSIIPMILTMIFTFLFLKKEFSKKAALLFLLSFLASGSIVHYAIEIRMYAWAFFFVTMAALCVWYIITTGKTLWMVLFVLCAEGAAYTHYYAAAVVAIGHLCFSYYTWKYNRKNTRSILWVALTAIILYLPWVSLTIHNFRTVSADFWIEPFTLMGIFRLVAVVLHADNSLFAFPLLIVFLIVLCRFLIKKERTKGELFAFWGFSCLVLLFLTGIFISLLTRPLLIGRYLFPACGLLWLFFAVEGATIKNKRIFTLLCGVMFSIVVVTLSLSFHDERKENKEFTQFHSYLIKNIHSDDIFVFPPSNSNHLPGIFACLFRGHTYVYEFGVGHKLSPTCWQMFGNTNISYQALAEPPFSNRRIWLAVKQEKTNGIFSPNPYVIPVDAHAQWCGTFGWDFFKFDLYLSEFPAAFIP